MCSYFEFLPCKDCEAKYLNCDVTELAFVTILLELELAIPPGAAPVSVRRHRRDEGSH